MMRLLAERAALLGIEPGWLLKRDAPGGLAPPGRVSANRHCGLMKTRDGWVALNLARAEDREVVPALGGDGDDPWTSACDAASRLTAMDFRDRAIELQLPVAVPGESTAQSLASPTTFSVPGRVLDLSALWAGPLCAALLARQGAQVVRIESIGRPDPTPQSSPDLDRRLNGAKVRLALDLRTTDGRDSLLREAERADVIVTSARAAALGRLDLFPERFADKTWVAITGHGWDSIRVGFGDDCAVAGGLLGQHDGGPAFVGDAMADPLTGLEAALAVLSGARGFLDISMARIAAAYGAAP